MNCLRKLSKTLIHIVWGLTQELLRATDLFLNECAKNPHDSQHLMMDIISKPREQLNYIPILKKNKPNPQSGDLGINEIDTNIPDYIDIISVPDLRVLLETIFINAKTKVILTPFSNATSIYLSNHFNNL